MLSGLGLLLARRPQVGHQGHVDITDVVPAHVLAELADRLQEREDLDVAHRAADLGDDDVDVLGPQALDPEFYLVGDVGDDLDRLAQVLAPALFANNRLVNGASGGVGVTGQRLVDEALVVAKVEVGFATVFGDEDLPVLEGVHGPRVNIDVWVKLLHRDPEAPAL